MLRTSAIKLRVMTTESIWYVVSHRKNRRVDHRTKINLRLFVDAKKSGAR
jgi:hypothetical protein